MALRPSIFAEGPRQAQTALHDGRRQASVASGDSPATASGRNAVRGRRGGDVDGRRRGLDARDLRRRSVRLAATVHVPGT
jgi:hypothetical protein